MNSPLKGKKSRIATLFVAGSVTVALLAALPVEASENVIEASDGDVTRVVTRGAE